MGLYHNKEIIDDISGKMDISETELEINELDEIDLEKSENDENKWEDNALDNEDENYDNFQNDIELKNEIKSMENKFIMNTYNYAPMDL